MRRLRGTTDAASDRLNAFVAGAVAGLSLVIDPDRRRRQSIMMYLLTRSLQFSGGWLMGQWSKSRQAKRQETLMQVRDRMNEEGFAEGQRRELTVEPTWEDVFAKGLQRYAGALVMMLANVQIIYGFLFDPDTLTKSYHSFLLYHSGWKDDFGNMAIPLTNAINDTVRRMAQGDDEAVPFRIPKDTTSRDFVAQHVSPNVASIIPHNIRHRYAVCALQHPLDASCTTSKLTLFRDGYGRALKLYVPLNVIMTLAFRFNQLKTDPTTVLQKFLKSCGRSAFFLAMYVAMGFATPCAVRPIVGNERLYWYYLPGVISGVTVLLEAPGRQLELALYCLTRAMESWWRTMVKRGHVKNLPHGDTLLFMLSMGTLMTIYQSDRKTIASHYLSVMTRFFGNN
ncbi:unnamed protein product [Absidia cylindrospora]